MKLLLKGLRRVTEIVTKTQGLYCAFRVTPVTLALTPPLEPCLGGSTPGKTPGKGPSALSFQVSEEPSLGWRLLPEKPTGLF